RMDAKSPYAATSTRWEWFSPKCSPVIDRRMERSPSRRRIWIPPSRKVIQRCLDPNPARRPSSALDVSRALPGGDPLAEALAAGETPSPEMVAASDDTGALSVRFAVACLVFIIAGLIGALVLSARTNPLRRTLFPDSPEILARKARDIAQHVGYSDLPA